ncbi:MAG: hypothetical protein M1335_01565 [Chloroflexi bacterium]|nr:hypothetical protein [Chloroflexota bacterium]MCL5025357.1 hypothetical protein [Chloroflexota bacterium]
MSWIGPVIVLGLYTFALLWWAHEYGRPGWRGVTRRRMRYVGWGKSKTPGKLDEERYAEGQEALVKGLLFLALLAAMLIGWVFLLVGIVAVGAS